MAAPSTSTCTPWATPDDLPASSPCAAEGFDADLLLTALQVASDVLFDFSRRRWPGTCESIIRPTRGDCRSCAPRYDGTACTSCCGRRLSRVRLPGVVTAVTEVKIDGVVVAPERYRVDGYRDLVYLRESPTAERQGWPCCQDLRLADTEVDTWSVTYEHGLTPPPGGVQSAAVLGCQLALAWSPGSAPAGQCRLPRQVTNVVRQGVTLAKAGPSLAEAFAAGSTGLDEVDLWLASVNRGAAMRSASVFRPDLAGRAPRRVGT